MKHQYSGTMKKLMKNTRWYYVKPIIIVFICLVTGLGIYSYMSSAAEVNAEKLNPAAFDPLGTISTMDTLSSRLTGRIRYKYSALPVQFLSGFFASNIDDTVFYCIAGDADSRPYIVGISAEDITIHEDLIEYSSNDSVDIPETVTMKGVPEAIDSDLGFLAADALNVFYGEGFTDSAGFSKVSGMLYLNTTKEPEPDYLISIVCISSAFALMIAYILAAVPLHQYKAHRKQAMGKIAASDLAAIEEELDHPDTVCLNKQKIYITANYLISKSPFFEIIPLREIVRVYILPEQPNTGEVYLVFVTREGTEHEIAIFPSENQDNCVITQIEQRVRSILPDVEFGPSGMPKLSDECEGGLMPA